MKYKRRTVKTGLDKYDLLIYTTLLGGNISSGGRLLTALKERDLYLLTGCPACAAEGFVHRENCKLIPLLDGLFSAMAPDVEAMKNNSLDYFKKNPHPLFSTSVDQDPEV